MEKYTSVIGVAAPLPEANIDTDIIFPARFLLLMEKAGLGKHVFHERRYNRENGQTPFVLNTAPFDQARILIAGRNFGIGSSREQAVWALMDFGFRCVIAPSFGEIFQANSFKNGLLCIVLPEPITTGLMAEAASGAPFTVDLEAQVIRPPNGAAIPFSVDAHSRRSLLLGIDESDVILQDDSVDIGRFEKEQRARAPWLYLRPDQLAYFDDIEAEQSAEAAP